MILFLSKKWRQRAICQSRTHSDPGKFSDVHEYQLNQNLRFSAIKYASNRHEGGRIFRLDFGYDRKKADQILQEEGTEFKAGIKTNDFS